MQSTTVGLESLFQRKLIYRWSKKLREVAKKVVEDKEYVDIVEKLGDEVRYMVGEDLTKYWDSESERVAKLYKQMIAEK